MPTVRELPISKSVKTVVMLKMLLMSHLSHNAQQWASSILITVFISTWNILMDSAVKFSTATITIHSVVNVELWFLQASITMFCIICGLEKISTPSAVLELK